MANIKKAFNFRNGVQVDNDNLFVNANGLVGVGTTVPSEALDVIGKIRVIAEPSIPDTGEINATTGIITSMTVTSTLEVGDAKIHMGQVGSGVSIGYPAGIITSSLPNESPAGIVTYYGDGQYLQNLPTSQWQNIDAGLGYLSIFVANTIGGVGIGTIDPRFPLQIGGNEDLLDFKEGVGISSGGIVATGIVTAGIGFTGSLTGNVVAGVATVGVLSVTDNVNVSGIVTAGIGFTGSLTGNVVAGVATVGFLTVTDNVNVSGIVTAGIGFTGSLTGDVVAGIATVGFATVGFLTSTGNVNVAGILTSGTLVSDQLESRRASITEEIDCKGVHASAGVVTALSAVLSDSILGIATASILRVDKIGIGLNDPTQDFDYLKVGIATVQIVGTESAILSIGQRSADPTGVAVSTGGMRFGSTDKTFDLYNGDNGDFNYYLQLSGQVGLNTGSFNWYHTTNKRMTLTYDGKLGINNDTPTEILDVIGDSRLTGNVTITNDLNVQGNINGTVSLDPILNGVNLNNTTGVSTIADIVVQNLETTVVAIGTDRDKTIFAGGGLDASRTAGAFGVLSVGTTATNNAGNALLVDNGTTSFGFNLVGIGTTTPADAYGTTGYGLKVLSGTNVFDKSRLNFVNGTVLSLQDTAILGVGTVAPRCAVDLSDAAYEETGASTISYMVPPKVTTTERDAFTDFDGGPVEVGAFIYNTTVNKLQVWDGTTWNNLH